MRYFLQLMVNHFVVVLMRENNECFVAIKLCYGIFVAEAETQKLFCEAVD